MAQIDYDSAPLEGFGWAFSFVVRPYVMHSWGITPTPAPTPPVVSNVMPAAGSTIAPGDAVSLDVTDDGEFRRVLLTAVIAGVPGEELVFNGTDFVAPYYSLSTRSVIPGGYRFRLVRTPGWPAPPTVTCYPFDTLGAEG